MEAVWRVLNFFTMGRWDAECEGAPEITFEDFVRLLTENRTITFTTQDRANVGSVRKRGREIELRIVEGDRRGTYRKLVLNARSAMASVFLLMSDILHAMDQVVYLTAGGGLVCYNLPDEAAAQRAQGSASVGEETQWVFPAGQEVAFRAHAARERALRLQQIGVVMQEVRRRREERQVVLAERERERQMRLDALRQRRAEAGRALQRRIEQERAARGRVIDRPAALMPMPEEPDAPDALEIFLEFTTRPDGTTATCPVCYEMYEPPGFEHEPVVLPCRHMMCRTCLDMLFRRGRTLCPFDQQPMFSETGTTARRLAVQRPTTPPILSGGRQRGKD